MAPSSKTRLFFHAFCSIQQLLCLFFSHGEQNLHLFVRSWHSPMSISLGFQVMKMSKSTPRTRSHHPSILSSNQSPACCSVTSYYLLNQTNWREVTVQGSPSCKARAWKISSGCPRRWGWILRGSPGSRPATELVWQRFPDSQSASLRLASSQTLSDCSGSLLQAIPQATMEVVTSKTLQLAT